MRPILLALALALPAARLRAQEPGPPPEIGDVAVAPAVSSATVTWATDRAADSRVEFGTSPAYGFATPPAPAPAVLHAATLAGLAPLTLYHYRVLSATGGGPSGASSDYTFTTMAAAAPAAPADRMPPLIVIMTPAPNAEVSSTATVSVNATDNVGVSSVTFLLDGQTLGVPLSSAPYTFRWDTRSAPDGPHVLAASASDASGNSATSVVVPLVVRNAPAPPKPAVAAPAATDSDAAARAPQKLLSPARADGINDAATFGPEAREVSVFDIRGHRVFHASSSGPGDPLIWRGKDEAGRVVESGVYLATVTKRDGDHFTQSFVLAK